eukprot:3633932-Pyramimonas_sp.AAC.1
MRWPRHPAHSQSRLSRCRSWSANRRPSQPAPSFHRPPPCPTTFSARFNGTRVLLVAPRAPPSCLALLPRALTL